MEIRRAGSQASRREFVMLLGGAAGAWSLAARAQAPRKPPTVGFLGPSTASFAGQWFAAFVQRLRELGWIEGRNIAIESRWAEGRTDRFAEIAAEFVRLKVDVILAPATPTVVAAKQATSDIPIVFSAAADPVGTGLVDSLVRPGGNVTGVSLQQTDLVSKRLELLREIVPSLHRLGIVVSVGNPAAVLELRQVEAAAAMLGLKVDKLEIRRAEDLAPAFDAIKYWVEALYVGADPLVNAIQSRINASALVARLPTIYNGREYIETGGLMSYGPNVPALYRRAADLVDKILRGTKPADIPVEQPTRFDFVINLTTAKALGLTVPRIMLARATEVIE